MPIITSGVSNVSNSLIGYKNLLTTSGGTITVSSEDTDYAKENAYDWRPFTWWKPTSTGDSWLRVSFGTTKSADYFAVGGHDLTTNGSSIKLQYSTNGGTSWLDATTATSGDSDRVIVEAFTSISAADWRIFVSNPTAIAAIGVVSFGEKLDLTKAPKSGFSPPTLSRQAEYLTNQSSGGLFLGRSIERTGYPGQISLDLMSPTWVRSNWEPLIDHAELKPFFFSWDSGLYTDEAVLAWTDGQMPPASYDSPTTMRVSLRFNASR